MGTPVVADWTAAGRVVRHDESIEEVVSVSGGLLEECVGVEGRKEKERAKSTRRRPSLATRLKLTFWFDIVLTSC